MCGIVGLVAPRIAPDARKRIVDAMCGAIVHRGPDGGGCFAGDDAAIGMRRLAIVDVEHGHQPMIGRDGRVVLVFNGEIYNAPEIRAELEAEGVAFDTRSDTEVILRLYERDPSDLEARLRGMWAFCVLDLARRRLVLSRDRFGIKPLFVMRAGASLAFASELRAFGPLRALGTFDANLALDGAAAHAMLAWGFVPNERTIHRGVERLAPATRLELDLATGEERRVRHWTCRPSPEAARVRSLDEAQELLRPVLREAVAQHLRSDVPVATFLSGGIDSTLVTDLAVAASPHPIEAFTIGFPDPRYDESPHARFVAERLGIRMHTTVLDPARAPELAVEALRAYDEPFGDSSAIATYAVSKLCAQTHKVALGGDGGDEAFAGYKKHRMIAVRALLDRAPVVRDGLRRALELLPAPADRSRRWTDALRKVRRVARALAPDDAEAYRALTQMDELGRNADLVEDPRGSELLERELEATYAALPGTPLQRALQADLANTLPNDLLTKVDRASMARSLEVRVPFLDHHVFELGLGLPPAFTLGRRGKEVLRAECASRFGRELAYRGKHGFEVPVEAWLRGPLAGVCEHLFERREIERHGVLSVRAFADGAWRAQVRNRPQIVWHALALAAWCEGTRHGDATRGLAEVA